MITSQNATSAGYSSIPDVIRDFYSKEVFRRAQPRLRFLQFAKVRRDLQAQRGKSVIFVKYDDIAGGGSIAEDADFTPQALSATEIQIIVIENMNAISVTELAIRTALIDQMEEASTALANDLAKTLDRQLRDAGLTTTNVIYGNGAASLAAIDSSSVFNARTVKDAVELLAGNNAPKIGGEYYVCFATVHQLRTLRDDPDWISSNTYGAANQRPLYIGEAGMYEGTVFIETTMMPVRNNDTEVYQNGVWLESITSIYGEGFVPSVGYEALIFGENTLAWGVALDPELRDDGVVQLGRKHTLGWYGIWGTGLLDTDYCVKILTT
jgi:N4-gp56 family major capsid protein